MKRIAKHFSALLMLAIVFATSTGFTMFSHLCFMDGKQEVSTTKIDSCCAHEEQFQGATFKGVCCNDESTFYKLDYTASVQRISAVDFNIVLIDLINFNTHPEAEIFVVHANKSLPPPKSGREILASNQVFRI